MTVANGKPTAHTGSFKENRTYYAFLEQDVVDMLADPDFGTFEVVNSRRYGKSFHINCFSVRGINDEVHQSGLAHQKLELQRGTVSVNGVVDRHDSSSVEALMNALYDTSNVGSGNSKGKLYLPANTFWRSSASLVDFSEVVALHSEMTELANDLLNVPAGYLGWLY